MIQVVLATSNIGKIKEIMPILKNYHISAIPQNELGVPEVSETGLTFIENALIKARHAAKFTGYPAIVTMLG